MSKIYRTRASRSRRHALVAVLTGAVVPELVLERLMPSDVSCRDAIPSPLREVVGMAPGTTSIRRPTAVETIPEILPTRRGISGPHGFP